MYKVVVVGTDGSPTADKAVQAAADLARAWGSVLHVVTAVRAPRPGMASATGAPLVDTGLGQAMVEEAAKAVGETAMQKFGDGLKIEAHAAVGNPDDVILNAAVDVSADLIVVGSKGMRGRAAISAACPTRWPIPRTARC